MGPSQFSRRSFIAYGAAGAAAAWCGCAGRTPALRLPEGVFPAYVDERTGARVHTLTPGASADVVVYQTHAMWTRNMEYLLFHSDRSGTAMAPHALCMRTGEVRPIIPDRCPAFALAWDSSDFYYLEGRTLYHLDVIDAFAGAARPEAIAELPTECLGAAGGLSAGAGGAAVYTAGVLEADKRWGLFACDLKARAWRRINSVDFPTGHVQANPYVPGQISFCHETGGDAPQRTWFADAATGETRPMYRETYGEWVTHEVWWGPDRMLFTIWPYDDAHRAKPHGVAVVGRDSGTMEILFQYPAWHTHGTRDGRWAMGDDFDRNIWLIDPQLKERRLLTQGHLGKDCKTHPHASFTPDGRAIVFASSRSGTDDVVLVEHAPWESLPA